MMRFASPHSATYLFDAMTSGIFAGDSKKLSIRSCFPEFWSADQVRGSVVRGMMLGGATANVVDTGPDVDSRFSDEMRRVASVSFKNGMSTFTNELAQYLEVWDGMEWAHAASLY